ncbi:catechol O-methyltransferase [Chlorella sorokiniana]|uniref:Catechol O-methyltransferase n=1 Tax=Chlorella sorokiniana TaxID=3076 RepID=A0A2P6TLJ2_CHLSO|nr:catechol O-methyltransferase [Chlorella sorokiniana]|eukprot:PRW45159.1 catechol O-methyltransferase [Chlorella sorokiniana]
MPPHAASIDSLPPDVLELIASQILAEVCPFFDRHDVLQLACNLTAAGLQGSRLLASHLFAFLSQRMGEELPCGVSEASKAGELKAALKEWGLPISGTKGELWQRLLDQVQDSEVDEEGEPPQYCLVSGATRAELTGYLHKLISQSRCKAVFNLTKGDLSSLSFQLQGGGNNGLPSKMYVLCEVKQEALRRYKTYDRILQLKQMSKDWQDEWNAKTEARRALLQQELLLRGHSVDATQAMLQTSDAGMYIWGAHDREAPAVACNAIECLQFARTVAYLHYVNGLYDGWEPPRSLSAYRQAFAKRQHAAEAALPRWVAGQPSLQTIKQHPGVPASLLPRLEALWAAQHPADAAA